jgi:thioredoxin 1
MAEILNDTNFEEKTKDGLCLIDFYAHWCGTCKMVAPIIEELSSEANFKVFKVNVDESPITSMGFHVRSIPTFYVLKDGETVDRMVGASLKKADYIALVEKHK